MSSRIWRNAFKIAWRESRASSGKFLFVILAVAAGVGALSGVRGFAGAFRDMLLRDARTLMAGDLTVRMYHLPDAEEQAALDAIVAGGAERTWITPLSASSRNSTSSTKRNTRLRASACR